MEDMEDEMDRQVVFEPEMEAGEARLEQVDTGSDHVVRSRNRLQEWRRRRRLRGVERGHGRQEDVRSSGDEEQHDGRATKRSERFCREHHRGVPGAVVS